MTFFYDLNKKLDTIREKPEVTHKQLNERGEKWIQGAVDPSHKGDLHKALHVPQGEKIPKSKINKATHSKDAHLRHMAQFAKNVAPKQEGVMDTVKKVGQRVASGVNQLVGHGSDEEMIADLQRKSGAPVTGKKPQNFADKIADAKKEVDEMLGDVAAEAIKTALSPKQKGIAKLSGNPDEIDAGDLAALRKGRKPEMDETNAFDYKSPRPMNKGERKPSSTGGEIHQKDDKTVVHTAGRNYGGGDEPDPAKEKQTRSGAPRKSDKPRQERVTAKSRKQDRTAHGQQGFKKAKEIEEGDNDSSELKAAMALLKKSGYKVTKAEGGEQELDEKAVSKKQQKFMGMVHAAQKGEKPASKAVAKVAKTMKKSDAEDFASTKHKGLPEKAPKKKKEEEVEESGTTSAGSVAPSTATKGGKGGVFGKGIYDSMNRELEQMIAESMSINMSDSTEGNKSLTITATDEDAMKLAMMLKAAGLGGDAHGDDMHSHGEEACDTCGMTDCGCGDVQEAVDENSPDWPTNTETSDDALQYAGGLNKPKADVAGDGQTTVPNTNVHTQEEDALRRMMEMAGLAEAAKPDFLDMDKDGDKEESMKDAVKDKEDKEDTVDESIQRMREMAGIKEAKKPDYLDFDKDGDKKEPMTKALKDKEEKKVDESIFALTNQWKAYKG